MGLSRAPHGNPPRSCLGLEGISAGPPHSPSSTMTLQVFAVERLNFITHLLAGLGVCSTVLPSEMAQAEAPFSGTPEVRAASLQQAACL